MQYLVSILKHIILIIVISTSALVISGCTSQSSTDPIIGTWVHYGYEYGMLGSIEYSTTLTFCSDGTCYRDEDKSGDMKWYKVSWPDSYPYKLNAGDNSIQLVDNDTLVYNNGYHLFKYRRVNVNEQAQAGTLLGSVHGKIVINGEPPRGYSRTLLASNNTYTDAIGEITFYCYNSSTGSYNFKCPIDSYGYYWISGVPPGDSSYRDIIIYGKNMGDDKSFYLETTTGRLLEMKTTGKDVCTNIYISDIYATNITATGMSYTHFLTDGTGFDSIPGGRYGSKAEMVAG